MKILNIFLHDEKYLFLRKKYWLAVFSSFFDGVTYILHLTIYI